MAICSNCGSSNVSFRRENVGEVRGRGAKQVVHRTVGYCKDCGYTWVVDSDNVSVPRKKNTLLWILGWLFLFPVPLTILLLRNKKMNNAVKYLIIGVAWVLYFLIALSNKTENNTTPAPAQNEPVTIAETAQQKEIAETAEPTSDLRVKFNEEIGDTAILFDRSVRNDVTGRWRLTRIATPKNIVDYAVDYYNAYFESDDEIHFVVNFTLKTTTVITRYGDNLDLTVHKYVDNEEHDAKIMPSGEVLHQYLVNINTGEITDITNA